MSTVKKAGMGGMALMPILFGFFVMGFADLIGTFMENMGKDTTLVFPTMNVFGLSVSMVKFLPSMIFIWFFLVSVPAGMMTSRIGRKNTVLFSLAVTGVAMILPFAVKHSVNAIYVSFVLLGIGNTIIQAALPALVSNVTHPDKLASRLSLGQFVKAMCPALTPWVLVMLSSWSDWRLLFPVYAGITLVAAVWLLMTPVPREVSTAQTTTFGGCLALLGNPFILAMFSGIFFVVGVDVGFNCAIPSYLQNVFNLENGKIGTTVYFVAKFSGSFLGAFILAKYSPAKCFPISALLALAGTVALFFVQGSLMLTLSCFAVASLGISNIFGIVFGQAMNRVPDKANEAAGLMVMAIAGGGIVALLMGVLETAIGVGALVYVPMGCIVYLIGLGVFVAKHAKRA